MLPEALIYFSHYRSIVQVDNHVNKLSVEINYSNDMLFHFLDNSLNLNICKLWVNYLDDKSLLTPYLVKYSRDGEWVKLLLTSCPEVVCKCRINELLILCCGYAHLEVVKWLVSNGANIRVGDYQPFRYACERGHLETAKYLLDSLDDLEEKKLCIQLSDDYVLRLTSARYSHIELVKLLVDNGANVRAKNYEPFRYACEYGHLETAKYLLSLIDTDEERKLCVQSNNNHALECSAKKGHLEVVKWLFDNGVNTGSISIETLNFACEGGHLEIAKYLLDLIDDVEQKKLYVQSDDCAIVSSATNGHLEVVKWLVNNGANIRANNYEPFRYTCQGGHLEIAKYLLSLIDTDEEKKLCVQSSGNHALRRSALYGHFEVVKWLVNNGANIRANEYEVLQSTCVNGYLEIAKYLFDLIDDIEEKKLCFQSCDGTLTNAVIYGKHEIVKWLIANGTSFRVDDYRTFQYACIHAPLEIAQYLFDLIDDPEEKNLCVQSNNNCALRWSAWHGRLEVVKWLVNNGANVKANDYEAFRDVHENVKDYLFDQLDEEEKQQVIDTLN